MDRHLQHQLRHAILSPSSVAVSRIAFGVGLDWRAGLELEGRGSGGEGRVVAQRGEREVEEDMSD